MQYSSVFQKTYFNCCQNEKHNIVNYICSMQGWNKQAKQSNSDQKIVCNVMLLITDRLRLILRLFLNQTDLEFNQSNSNWGKTQISIWTMCFVWNRTFDRRMNVSHKSFVHKFFISGMARQRDTKFGKQSIKMWKL